MKPINYYLQSIPITLGIAAVLRIGFCLFDAYKITLHPLTPRFWNYFYNSLICFSPGFIFFIAILLIAILVLQYLVRKAEPYSE
jgi:hypothetical protein